MSPVLPWKVNLRPGVVVRSSGDDLIFLRLDGEVLYTLDGVGSRLWTMLTSKGTVAEAVAGMLAEFEVERSQLLSDIEEFLCDLERHGLCQIQR